MSDDIETDEIDTLVRRSMQQRPEPVPGIDLAARAIAQGSAVSRIALDPLRRVRFWNRVLSAAAALIILGLSFWILQSHYNAGGFQTWSVSTYIDSSAATTSDTSSSSSVDWLIAFGIASIGVVVVLIQSSSGGWNNLRTMENLAGA